MKRLLHCNRSPKRRGTIFHYYMAYLFLSGVLLTSAGLTLHVILKASQDDAAGSQQLKTLLQLDRALRCDGEEASNTNTIECLADKLTLSSGTTVIVWAVQENRLIRSQHNGDQLQSSRRFVFPRGTELLFEPVKSGSLVKLTITDPPIVTTTRNASVATASPRQSVQMTFVIEGLNAGQKMQNAITEGKTSPNNDSNSPDKNATVTTNGGES